jgi:hypothetical protein
MILMPVIAVMSKDDIRIEVRFDLFKPILD